MSILHLIYLGRVGDQCSTDNHCNAVITNSVCNHSTCLCQLGYKTMGNNTTCTKMEITDSCMENEQCSTVVGQSFCYQGRCSCMWGFKAVNRTSCVPKIVGDTCHFNETFDECKISVSNSNCNRIGICECILGYKEVNVGKACRKRVIEDHCVHDEDCSHMIPFSACTDRKCECVTGYKSSRDLSTCSSRLLGDSCSLVKDCLKIENAECLDYQCACPLGFYNHNHISCRPFRLGTDCTIDLDCNTSVPHSHCRFLSTPQNQTNTSRLSKKLSSSLLKGRRKENVASSTPRKSSTGDSSPSSPSSALFISSSLSSSRCSCFLGYYALNTSICIRSKLLFCIKHKTMHGKRPCDFGFSHDYACMNYSYEMEYMISINPISTCLVICATVNRTLDLPNKEHLD